MDAKAFMKKHKLSEGQLVKIYNEGRAFEGNIIPSAGKGKNILALKLKSGYNVGIKISPSTKAEKLEGVKKVGKGVKTEIRQDPSLPKISILHTGGTIASRVDYRSGAVYSSFEPEDLLSMFPELLKIGNFSSKLISNMWSDDLRFKHFGVIGKEVLKEYEKGAKGIIIGMGTDNMAVASAAMAFVLEKCPIPVIFVGAQRSSDRGSSDAFMNLICAVNAAAKSDIAEVMTCMHGTSSDDYCLLIRGTKVRKMHSSRRDAFRPVNEIPFAKVFADGKIEILNNHYRKKNRNKVVVDSKFEEKIALVQVYPGMNPEIIDFYAKKGYKGIVLSATALGHVPTLKQKYSLLPNLKKAIKKKISVIIASQTLYGRVHPYVYTNLRKLSMELDSVFAGDMLPEVAYVKLGWVLAHTKNPDEVKKLMLVNYAGEISERSVNGSYLY